ncbi:MAG TPA: glycosyltransferase family 87 protein [Solirubrobacteraceae bacterium]|nr:glycosyltransferase family 87 protein [Solirubrobacteraceae bacterium]
MSRSALLGAAAVFALVGVLATTVGPTSDARITDLPIYQGIAASLDRGAWPYEHAETEYPPVALLPMWVAGRSGDFAAAFGLLMLAAAVVTFWVTVRLAEAGGGSGVVCAGALVLSPLAVGALYRTHFDAWPAAMTITALLALARERPRLGLGLLGLGTATKLFPALLVPMTLVWLVARGQRRAAWQGAAVFAIVVGLIAVPFVAHGLGRVVTFHLDRPVQVESTPATVLLALGDSTVTGVPGHPDGFKSQGLVGGPAHAVADVAALLGLAAIVAVAFAARRRPDARWLVLCAFATVVAFVALGKVLSPQFVIWLVPFAALAWAWREWATAAAVTAAVVLTQFEFPSRYWDLVAGNTGTAVLVGVRNLLLLVALTSLLAQVAAPARWRRPAAATTP